jgi:molybdopterin converting factor small subunit
MPNVSVKVMLFATLMKKYKTEELIVECDGTLKGLIENTVKILGEEFFNDIYDKGYDNIRKDIIFLINGRSIKDLKEEVKLKDNDVISIFPPLAGG